MAFRVKYYILFLLVFSSSLSLSGQNSQFIEHFSIKDGLSHNGATSLFFDSKGFLWIGTQDGLNRFDGNRFVVFRNEDYDSLSLSYNNINAITQDLEGNIWIATQDGLNKLSLANGKFSHYYHEIDDAGVIQGDNIRDVYVDKQNNIWCATNQSLDFKSNSKDEFIQFWHFSDVLKAYTEQTGTQILEDSCHNIWLGTKDGLFYFNVETKDFQRYFANKKVNYSLSNNVIKDICLDKSGKIWIATNDGLNCFFENTQKFKSFKPVGIKKDEAFKINDLWYDGDKKLWLATTNGLSLFDVSEGLFVQNETIDEINNEIQHSNVNNIVNDQKDNIWISTYHGIYKIEFVEQQFGFLNYDKNQNPYFGNNVISSIYKLNSNQILVGTWGTGLYLYNIGLKTSVKVERDSIKNSFNRNIHWMLFEGEVVLLGTDNGVYVYQIEKNIIIDFEDYYHVKNTELLADNRIYQIERINGKLWVASSNGVFILEKDELIELPLQTLENTFYSSLVLFNKTLWIGTGKGLYFYNLLDSSLSSVKYLGNNWEEFKLYEKEIMCMKKADESLYIGTADGLFNLKMSPVEISKFGSYQGLINEVINSIEIDKNKNIWFSTNKGISKLNHGDSIVTNFDISYGLQGYEFNLNASHLAADGELFFGGISGLNFFYPNAIKHLYRTSPIAISSIEIIDGRGIKKLFFEDQNKIVVSDDFQLISVEFTSLEFNKFDKNKYEYTFSKSDNLWIDISNKNYLTLTDLEEGSHTLRIRKSGSINSTDSNLAIEIEVKAPFYRSRPVVIVYFVFGGLLLFLIPLMKIQNVRKSNLFLMKQQEVMGELSIQKEQLIVKNKNITDSINYAKRIQEAIMPSENLFNQILPESFVFYNPKDIVSGDFYWINENFNKIFVAVVDCTGHGVPGAFMSIIGIELLRNITILKGINDAAEVLNELNKGLKEIFSLDFNNNPYVKDGMDVSLIVIDKEMNNLQFAGALNIMYLIRDNKIIELKGERYAVGLAEIQNEHYTDHNLTLEPTDMLYLFTDGYADQFGGPEGKKYKYRRFRQLLLNIHNLSMQEQQNLIRSNIIEWRGEIEQVDDMLVIGIRPDLSCYFNY